MSRGRLSAITLVVLLLVLVVAALVGWRALTAPLPADEPATTASCAEQLRRGDVVRGSDVTVSVFNAGTRSGLASQTQQQLSGRGFLAGEVGNAPGALADVRGALVLAPSADDPAARLVARQLGRDVEVRATDDDLGPGVDVVVGDSFKKLVKAPQKLRARAAGSGC
jgi:LytR cell envelope-related transcriptional attenuator